jgi:serine/threonine-protein kinase
MSPEQARSPRDVDHRTDLYSVGAMLYEMLCGRTPYTAESGEYTEILFKIFTTEPESLRVVSPGLPDGIADVVHRALARDRNSRFGSAAEMAAALGPYADARSSQVLTRIHSARGRSLIPPAGSHTVTPMAPELRVPTSEAVSALTYSAASGSEALRAPPVPTDVGLTRESAGATPAGSRRGALFAIVGAVAVVGGTVGTVVALRPARPEPGHDPSAITASPPPSITAAAAPPLPAPPAPPAPPPAGTTAAPADKVILPPSGTGPASDASGAAPASSSTSSSSPPAVASPKPPPQEARTGGSSTNCLSCIIIR